MSDTGTPSIPEDDEQAPDAAEEETSDNPDVDDE